MSGMGSLCVCTLSMHASIAMRHDRLGAPCRRYANCYCSFSSGGWSCSLCGKANYFRPFSKGRYQVPLEQLSKVPEVACHAYEAVVGDPVRIQAGPKGFSG